MNNDQAKLKSTSRVWITQMFVNFWLYCTGLVFICHCKSSYCSLLLAVNNFALLLVVVYQGSNG